jgi:hypothetical protein
MDEVQWFCDSGWVEETVDALRIHLEAQRKAIKKSLPESDVTFPKIRRAKQL